MKALYFRDDPVIAGAPPLKPPILTFGVPLGPAAIWNYLESADVPDVRATRCDPKSAITIVDDCWSTPLDPAMPPDKKDAQDFTNSRAILNAARPYAWRDKFPPVSALGPELKKKISEKWKAFVE